MLNDVARDESLAGLSEAVKAFNDYEQSRRYIRKGEFAKAAEILEEPVERAARLRKKQKTARAKRLNKKRK